MADYLKKENFFRKRSSFQDYSLSNNNIDKEYAEIIGGLSCDQMTRLINQYPDYEYSQLLKIIRKTFKVSKVVLGCGSEDLIIRINAILKKRGGIGIFLPNFYRIMETAGKYKKIYMQYDLDSEFLDYINDSRVIINQIKSLWISNPNPMIGKVSKRGDIIRLIKNNKKVLFIVDESAIDFLDKPYDYSVIDVTREVDNLIVVRSFSKLYGIAGLRAAFATGRAEVLEKIEKVGLTFPINGVAEYFVRKLLKNESAIRRIKKKIKNNKLLLEKILSENRNIVLSKSVTNCLFFGHKEKDMFPELLNLGINALDLNNQDGLKERNFVRVTVHSSGSLFKNLHKKLSRLVKIM